MINPKRNAMRIEIEIPIDRVKELIIKEFGLAELEAEQDLILIGIDNQGETSPFTYLRVTN